MYIRSLLISIGIVLLIAGQAASDENPDKLYRQGRFEEAEKIYTRKDMDNPKDVRYRFNRGCAAYQKSDFQGAMASFSSVARRIEDDEIRFKAAYNMGNAAFKQNDYTSAYELYKTALRYKPDSVNARHNFELTLRALKQQEEQQNQDQNQQNQCESPQDGDKSDQKQQNKSDRQDDRKEGGDSKDTESPEKDKESEVDSQNREQDEQKEDKSRQPQSGQSEENKDQDTREAENEQRNTPEPFRSIEFGKRDGRFRGGERATAGTGFRWY